MNTRDITTLDENCIAWTYEHPTGRLDKFCFDMDKNILHEIDNFSIDFNHKINVEDMEFEWSTFEFRGRSYRYTPYKVFMHMRNLYDLNSLKEGKVLKWEYADSDLHVRYLYCSWKSRIKSFVLKFSGDDVGKIKYKFDIQFKDLRDKGYKIIIDEDDNFNQIEITGANQQDYSYPILGSTPIVINLIKAAMFDAPAEKQADLKGE
jgi:hypothetical protein